MRPAGDPHLISSESAGPGWQVADSRLRIRVSRAANDNHRTHATWRRFVAVGMAALFAASLLRHTLRRSPDIVPASPSSHIGNRLLSASPRPAGFPIAYRLLSDRPVCSPAAHAPGHQTAEPAPPPVQVSTPPPPVPRLSDSKTRSSKERRNSHKNPVPANVLARAAAATGERPCESCPVAAAIPDSPQSPCNWPPESFRAATRRPVRSTPPACRHSSDNAVTNEPLRIAWRDSPSRTAACGLSSPGRPQRREITATNSTKPKHGRSQYTRTNSEVAWPVRSRSKQQGREFPGAPAIAEPRPSNVHAKCTTGATSRAQSASSVKENASIVCPLGRRSSRPCRVLAESDPQCRQWWELLPRWCLSVG